MRYLSSPFIFIIILMLSLTACGQKDQNTKPSQEDAAKNDTITDVPSNDVTIALPENNNLSTPQNIATTDQPIPLPAPATGISVWDHPSLPFESLILAATPDGLYAHTLEGTDEILKINDMNAKNIALTFWNTDSKAAPKKENIHAVFSVYDNTNKGFRFFQINDSNSKIEENLISIKYANPVENYCLGIDPDAANKAGALLMILGNDLITTIKITPNPEASPVINSVPSVKTMSSCAIDNLNGNIYVASAKGDIHQFKNNALSQPPLITGKEDNIISFAITHNQYTDEKNKTQKPQSQFVLLNQNSGQVHLYDAKTTLPLGILQLAPFDVNEGVLQASAMGVGHGNYGGLYRFGVIALGASDNNPAVKLTPFIAAANALNLPLSNIINPRSLLIDQPSPTQTLIGLDKVRSDIKEVFPERN